MKNIVFILSLLMITGCFVDKGNYSYREINDILIDISSTPLEYNVMQYEKLTIQPQIKFTGQILKKRTGQSSSLN